MVVELAAQNALAPTAAAAAAAAAAAVAAAAFAAAVASAPSCAGVPPRHDAVRSLAYAALSPALKVISIWDSKVNDPN